MGKRKTNKNKSIKAQRRKAFMLIRTPSKGKIRKIQRKRAFMQVTKNFTNGVDIEIPKWMLHRLLVLSYVRRSRKERTGYYLKNKSK